MAKVELLTVSEAVGLFSLRGAYFIGYAWLFGMCKSVLVKPWRVLRKFIFLHS